MKYRPKFHVNLEDLEGMKKKFEEGMTYEEIAKHYERDVQSVIRALSLPHRVAKEVYKCPCCNKRALRFQTNVLKSSKDDFEYAMKFKNSRKSSIKLGDSRYPYSTYDSTRVSRLICYVRFWTNASWEAFNTIKCNWDGVQKRVTRICTLCSDCGLQLKTIDLRPHTEKDSSLPPAKKSPLATLEDLSERELLGLLLKKMYGNMESSTQAQRTA